MLPNEGSHKAKDEADGKSYQKCSHSAFVPMNLKSYFVEIKAPDRTLHPVRSKARAS